MALTVEVRGGKLKVGDAVVDKLKKPRTTRDEANESGQRARFDPPPDADARASQLRRRFASENAISGFEHAAPPPRRLTPAKPPRRSTKEYGDLTALREEVREPVRHDSRSEGFVPEADVGDGGIPTPRPKLPLGAVPRRRMGAPELRALPLDHREGFVLAHIDGTTSIRTLLDVCGMSHDEIAVVVERLLSLRAIVLR